MNSDELQSMLDKDRSNPAIVEEVKKINKMCAQVYLAAAKRKGNDSMDEPPELVYLTDNYPNLATILMVSLIEMKMSKDPINLVLIGLSMMIEDLEAKLFNAEATSVKLDMLNFLDAEQSN